MQITFNFGFQITLLGRIFEGSELEGVEVLGEPYKFNLVFYCEESLAINCLMPASLRLFSHEHRYERFITGIVTKIEKRFSGFGCCFEVTVEPKLSLLKHMRGPKVYRQESLGELSEKNLLFVGYAKEDILGCLLKQKNSGFYHVQSPQENAFDFLQRLWFNAGLFYGFQSEGEREKLYFVDNPFACDAWFDSSLSFSLHEKDITANYCYKPLSVTVQETSLDTGMRESYMAGEGVGLIFDGFASPEESLSQRARVLKNHFQRDSQSIYFCSKNIFLQVGQTLTLKSSLRDENYLITRLQHRARQSPVLQERAQEYILEVFAISKDTPFTIASKSILDLPAFMQGCVASCSEHPSLDERGAYYWRYSFEDSNASYGQQKPTIPYLSNYGGSHEQFSLGQHHPLSPGKDVLISFLQGNSQRPYISAALPGIENISPVTNNNAQEYKLITAQGCELLIVENTQAQEVSLLTPHNSLSLSQGKENKLQLKSEKGFIGAQAKGPLLWESHGNYEKTIKGNYHENTGQDISITSERCIGFYSGQEAFLAATESLTLQGEESLLAEIQENFHLSSPNNIKSESQQLYWRLEEGSLNINGATGVFLKAAGERLELSAGLSFLELKEESLTMTGAKIQLTVEAGIHLEGSVHYE